VISLYTSVGLILLSPLGEPSSVLRLDALSVWILLLSALVGVAIAHGLYYISVQRIGVAVAALTLVMTPFLSFLGSHLLFGERLSAGQWAAAVVLLSGAAMALWSQQRLSPTDLDTRQPEAKHEP